MMLQTKQIQTNSQFNLTKNTTKKTTQNDSNKQNKKLQALLKEKSIQRKKIKEPAKRFKSHLIKGC